MIIFIGQRSWQQQLQYSTSGFRKVATALASFSKKKNRKKKPRLQNQNKPKKVEKGKITFFVGLNCAAFPFISQRRIFIHFCDCASLKPKLRVAEGPKVLFKHEALRSKHIRASSNTLGRQLNHQKDISGEFLDLGVNRIKNRHQNDFFRNFSPFCVQIGPFHTDQLQITQPSLCYLPSGTFFTRLTDSTCYVDRLNSRSINIEG